MTDFSLAMIMPLKAEIFMALAGLALLVFGAFRGDKAGAQIGWLASAVCAVAIALVLGGGMTRMLALNDMFVSDAFAVIMKTIILGGMIASITLSIRYLREEGVERFEYPLLMLFSAIGMMVMVSAHDLLALYMGLELQSLALYVLAAIRRDNVKSAEAGLKYFVLGAISSGMLLFGVSLVYGYTGSTNFDVIGHALAGELSVGAVIGMVFILAGIAFKISAVPFHMWTPDVYEGAPMPVTAFFALVPKMAAMALLMRMLYEAFPAAIIQWQQIICILAVLSMAVGAFAGLLQDNLKRLLAYSSIGNMGFALVGLAAATQEGLVGLVVYMIIYMAMTAGTFAIILSMRRGGSGLEQIADLSGLSRNHPVMAYALAVLMFSMSGIPPLAGFFGKLLVFKAAVGMGMFWLAVFGVLCSVVAAYYYLRIIKVMFFDEPVAAYDVPMPWSRRAVTAFSVAFVLLFILLPSPVMNASERAVSVFFNGQG
ncbi:MAG: NADH-quinone oxidoreductase subunit NuoN [Micavibrio sp.]